MWVGEFGLFQEGLLVCFFKGKNTLNIFQIFFSFHLNDTLGIFRRGLIWYSETNDWLVNEQPSKVKYIKVAINKKFAAQ